MFANGIAALFRFYEFMIIAWCIFSWFPHRNEWLQDLYAVLDKLVAPYMNMFRRFIPPMGGFDFSPIVGIMVLHFIARLVVRFFAGIL